jgi:hypothetical protein
MNENELLERWGLCGGAGSMLANRLTGDVEGVRVSPVFMNNQCLQHGYNTHL